MAITIDWLKCLRTDIRGDYLKSGIQEKKKERLCKQLIIMRMGE